MSTTAQLTKKTVLSLLLVVVGMFAFGFVLVPIYDVFCRVTGLNGKTSNEAYTEVPAKVDSKRMVTIQFIATNNDNMSWEFKPEVTSIQVHPGEMTSTTFFAKNPTAAKMVAQAIPSVSPGRAAEFFHKAECFCFNQQKLEGGESVNMPLKFVVEDELPKDIETITLAYTLFDVTKNSQDEKVN